MTQSAGAACSPISEQKQSRAPNDTCAVVQKRALFQSHLVSLTTEMMANSAILRTVLAAAEISPNGVIGFSPREEPAKSFETHSLTELSTVGPSGCFACKQYALAESSY